ncbi:MAG TPA: hypothetical protein VED37_00470 [Ktedonobacteraceae bacterium]|nr:hypothetical protein [Ktedonobacteraceae bacterium]
MAHRNGGLLASAPQGQSLILGREVAVLAVYGSMSGLHPGGAQEADCLCASCRSYASLLYWLLGSSVQK